MLRDHHGESRTEPASGSVDEHDSGLKPSDEVTTRVAPEEVDSLLVPGLAGIAYWFVLFAVLFPIMFLLGSLLG